MKHVITLTVDVLGDDSPSERTRIRRLSGQLEGLMVEGMGLTGRRGFTVGVEVAAEAEKEGTVDPA